MAFTLNKNNICEKIQHDFVFVIAYKVTISISERLLVFLQGRYTVYKRKIRHVSLRPTGFFHSIRNYCTKVIEEPYIININVEHPTDMLSNSFSRIYGGIHVNREEECHGSFSG